MLTLCDEITIKSKLYKGVEYIIKVLTPKDVESIALSGDNATTNSELVERFCVSISGVDYKGKAVTEPSELLTIGGTTRLVGEIASEILHYAFLGEDEKND